MSKVLDSVLKEDLGTLSVTHMSEVIDRVVACEKTHNTIDGIKIAHGILSNEPAD